jgi:hypothetical protein
MRNDRVVADAHLFEIPPVLGEGNASDGTSEGNDEQGVAILMVTVVRFLPEISRAILGGFLEYLKMPA